MSEPHRPVTRSAGTLRPTSRWLRPGEPVLHGRLRGGTPNQLSACGSTTGIRAGLGLTHVEVCRERRRVSAVLAIDMPLLTTGIAADLWVPSGVWLELKVA
jgi:hypothetical protein